MIILTLRKLVDTGCHICHQKQFYTLMSHMGKTWETIDNTEISLLEIIRLTDIDFGLDCMEANPEHQKMWRQFGLWCIEPVVFLISIPSCREAYETSIKFINDEVSIEVLKEKHYVAACEQNIYSEGNYYVNFSSDEMALNFSEPDFFDCAYKCYNHYPQAMNPLGISFDNAQKKINKRFIDMIS